MSRPTPLGVFFDDISHITGEGFRKLPIFFDVGDKRYTPESVRVNNTGTYIELTEVKNGQGSEPPGTSGLLLSRYAGANEADSAEPGAEGSGASR